jgi:hypothetical protein
MSKIKNFYHDEIAQGLHYTSGDEDYGYAEWLETQTTHGIEKEIRTEAERLGILAQRNGLHRTPAHDPSLIDLIREADEAASRRKSRGLHSPAAALTAIRAWLQGWEHEQSIAAEIEAAHLAQIENWEAEEADRELPRWLVTA